MASNGALDAGLDKLLEDLVRDGWLMGMNAGMDPALARMDRSTGVFNREHFSRLIQVAIDDSRRGRERIGDGPVPGNVAVLSVRVIGWEALERAGWVVGGPQGAAADLGMPASSLRFRMKKLGLQHP